MAVLDIITVGNPTLRERALEVAPEKLGNDEIQSFIDDLVDTMRAAKGAGLAATQVAQPWRICAVEVKDNPRYPYKPNIPLSILVNPVLEPLGEHPLFENYEGCLSVPNLRGRVRRHPEVRVRALDRRGTPLDFIARGLAAGTYQHEVDHLDGLLFLDRVEEPRSLATWENYEKFHKAQFEEEARKIVARWGR